MPSVSESVPNNTMSISPSASDGATITASDENTRNTNISTPYNAHSHTDISPTSIQDSDGDTQVQTEETSGEDIIRMDTNGTERWNMSATGELTMVTQPAFMAQNAVEQTNIATGSAVEIVFGTEVFDQNADFASNTFTAPVTGRYQLNYSLRLANLDSAATDYQVGLITSNRTFNMNFDPQGFSQDLTFYKFTFDVLADMDTNDTAVVNITQVAGAAQTDLSSGGSTFSGYLAF